MIKSIFELVNSKAIAMYWQGLQSNSIPYLGSAFFPDDKKLGLKLEFIKGYDSLPVALMPSAFDTKPTLREGLTVKDFETKMPFFRESARVNEEDRQQLLMFQEQANNLYAKEAVRRIYDTASGLVSGASVQAERMRMSLLVDGTISIIAPTDSGISARYEYNYDPNGEWADANTSEAVTDWSDANADIYGDILTIKKTAAGRGTALTRGILTTKTWGYMCKNDAIKKDMNPVGYQNMILSDSDIIKYFQAKLGITFVIYDKKFKDEAKQDKQFYPDDMITFVPDGTLGKTWYGTTPEEADLLGATGVDVSIVNTGVAILHKQESLPVNLITSVSQIVLPSFERMNDVYTIKVV